MTSVWFTSELSEEIIKNDDIYNQTQSIIADLLSNQLQIASLFENMRGALTSKEIDDRAKGMRFFTHILKSLPNQCLNEAQIKFISHFYVDRLKDNHRIIPAVLEGYLAMIDMKNYNITLCTDFLLVLFREVSCQSHLRQDRYNIYSIIKTLLDRDLEFLKKLGPDFIYGVITMIDGERDPRNLIFLFSFLPKLINEASLGHLTQDMFDVIACYYPIDFHPNPDDPAAVTRQDLADALSKCLCATADFGENTLVLLLEKLQSSLLVAKLDSFKLLIESCNTFNPKSYTPFLKALWSAIHQEMFSKVDNGLKMAAHEALFALVKKISVTANTDHAFESFVEGIILSMQTVIAESDTVQKLVQATKVLLTTANASKESAIIVTGTMIPATIRFYSFKQTPKLQLCSLEFLGDLFEIAKHWEVLDKIQDRVQAIPDHCLIAVSKPQKDYQIAGFRTLIKVIEVLPESLVVPFVEVLCYNVQHSQDTDLLQTSVDAIHHIAKKYPELIMNVVVKEKCGLNNLPADKTVLHERLNLLCNLVSIDDFTKVILEDMLKFISDKDLVAADVVRVLNATMSHTRLYSNKKVTEIESDHNLINSVINWIISEMSSSPQEALSHGFELISNTMSNLTTEKQGAILKQHTKNIMDMCEKNEMNFLLLKSLYISVHQSIHNDWYPDILNMSLKLSIKSGDSVIRTNACALVAHFLNKAESGPNFELLYELLKTYISLFNAGESSCHNLIKLYGWITKALIMRGNSAFLFWLQKIVAILPQPHYCTYAADAIGLIMSTDADHLTPRQHCIVSLLYRQRMFVAFSELVEKLPELPAETREHYLLSWGLVLDKVPKSVLNTEALKIVPLVIESLAYNDKDLHKVMLDVLSYYAQRRNIVVSGSLQTVLSRLLKLTQFPNIDVRMKSLQCLYDIASVYRTSLLLPHKQDVLLQLAPALDDKKRVVRNMAVRARTRWFLIGAPGEAKDN